MTNHLYIGDIGVKRATLTIDTIAAANPMYNAFALSALPT